MTGLMKVSKNIMNRFLLHTQRLKSGASSQNYQRNYSKHSRNNRTGPQSLFFLLFCPFCIMFFIILTFLNRYNHPLLKQIPIPFNRIIIKSSTSMSKIGTIRRKLQENKRISIFQNAIILKHLSQGTQRTKTKEEQQALTSNFTLFPVINNEKEKEASTDGSETSGHKGLLKLRKYFRDIRKTRADEANAEDSIWCGRLSSTRAISNSQLVTKSINPSFRICCPNQSSTRPSSNKHRNRTCEKAKKQEHVLIAVKTGKREKDSAGKGEVAMGRKPISLPVLALARERFVYEDYDSNFRKYSISPWPLGEDF